jgi:hypothetical protein
MYALSKGYFSRWRNISKSAVVSDQTNIFIFDQRRISSRFLGIENVLRVQIVKILLLVNVLHRVMIIRIVLIVLLDFLQRNVLRVTNRLRVLVELVTFRLKIDIGITNVFHVDNVDHR